MAKTFGNTLDLVEIDTVRNDSIVLKDGSLRQIIMVGGVNFSLKSEQEQEAITYTYQNFLNSLDFQVQIVIHSRKINIDDYLELLDKRAKEEPSELLQSQIGEYREFIRSFVKDNPIMAKTFLVVVPFFPVRIPDKETVGKFVSFIPFLGKKEKTKEEIEKEKEYELEKNEEIEKEIEQLRQRTNQVIEGLRAIDLELKVLNNEELVELIYNFYNPSAVENKKISEEIEKAEKQMEEK